MKNHINVTFILWSPICNKAGYWTMNRMKDCLVVNIVFFKPMIPFVTQSSAKLCYRSTDSNKRRTLLLKEKNITWIQLVHLSQNLRFCSPTTERNCRQGWSSKTRPQPWPRRSCYHETWGQIGSSGLKNMIQRHRLWSSSYSSNELNYEGSQKTWSNLAKSPSSANGCVEAPT